MTCLLVKRTCMSIIFYSSHSGQIGSVIHCWSKEEYISCACMRIEGPLQGSVIYALFDVKKAL